MSKTLPQLDKQFEDEPYEESPDPKKEYYFWIDKKSDGFTHLMKCVFLSKKHKLELTQKNINEINNKNKHGYTALMFACNFSNIYSNQETVDTLIKAGADLNIQDIYGHTALMLASGYANTCSRQETVDALIKAGADLNIKDNNGWTALMYACRVSNSDSKYDTVKALIQAGADLNIQENYGMTALMFACKYSNTNSNQETVDALIKAGADLDIECNDTTQTALVFAWICTHVYRCYEPDDSKQETIDALIQAGADFCCLITEFDEHYSLQTYQTYQTYQTIINRWKHNQSKIQLIYDDLCDGLKQQFDYYRQCVTNLKYIPEVHTELYHQPNNVSALISQFNFAFKSGTNSCSPKYIFLTG